MRNQDQTLSIESGKGGEAAQSRVKTNGSLSHERRKTDEALSASARTSERDVALELEATREASDQETAEQRILSNNSSEMGKDLAACLQSERDSADASREAERGLTDETLQRERIERRAEEHAFFADQRIRTDKCLQFERIRSDLASSLAAKRLTDEQAAHDATKKAVTNRDEFLAIVSHDLRSPLSMISMCADALAEEHEGKRLSPELMEFVDIISRQAASMNRLIVDLLDVEHMVSGELTTFPAPCDLSKLVQEATDSFQMWASKQHIDLVSALPRENIVVSVDRDRIWQVLSNLIGNALKFTPEGGSVTVSLELMHEFVRISVRDTGVGIDADQQSQIFHRFSQIKKYDRRGVGLGLFIAKWIVEAHRGNIRVESTLGKGSTFVCMIPFSLS